VVVEVKNGQREEVAVINKDKQVERVSDGVAESRNYEQVV